MKGTEFFLKKPWLQYYPKDVKSEIAIPDTSLSNAFDESAEKWKNRTAVVFYGRKISFKELKNKVDRLATALFALGVRKGDRVALLLLNSPEHIISFFAVIKIGAVVTPVNPVYVSTEIANQIKNSGAETIICQDILYEGVDKTGISFKNVIITGIAESLPTLKRLFGKSVFKGFYQKSVPIPDIAKKENFFQLQDLLKKYPPNPPQIEQNPQKDLVTISYTGGTTGLPKGVMATHHNILATLTELTSFHSFLQEGNEVCLGNMPYYHIGGQMFGMLLGVLKGITQVVVTTPDLDDIINAIIDYDISFIIGAPSLFEALKDYEKTNRVEWDQLKIIMSGADALHEFTSRDWKECTGTTMHSIYGMTEVGLVSLSPLGKEKEGAVGIPVPNTQIALLDPDENQHVAQGEIGELAITGPQVTIGYWQNETETKKCQVEIDGRIYWRTGDLCRIKEDGYIYIYDRKRDIIKYQGIRIYPREIEEVLKIHPQIKEVGVIGLPDEKNGELVKAMVVLESDSRGNLSEKEIIEYCNGKLPDFMIPRLVEFVGEIPKTDVGKVSRRELREVED